MASLYFWSGVTKLFNRSFFDFVVPGFFAPLTNALELVGIKPRWCGPIVKGVAFVGVVGEALMGVILWFGPSQVKYLAALFNLGMHR